MELAQKFAFSSTQIELQETGLGFDTRTFGGYIAAGDVTVKMDADKYSDFFMDVAQ